MYLLALHLPVWPGWHCLARAASNQSGQTHLNKLMIFRRSPFAREVRPGACFFGLVEQLTLRPRRRVRRARGSSNGDELERLPVVVVAYNASVGEGRSDGQARARVKESVFELAVLREGLVAASLAVQVRDAQ